ncbi:MAG: ubiquinone/menaquinone biosynthesis C-methylase UbiE [Planctomycetota bacterium]
MTDAQSKMELARIKEQFDRRDQEVVEHEKVQAYFDGCRHRVRRQLLHTCLKADAKLLDVGCGAGDWLVALKDEGALEHNLHGIDQSESRCERARERLPKAQVITGSASQLDFESGAFDGLVLSLVLSSIHTSELRQAVIDEAWRVLAPGGWLLVHDLHRSRPGGDARATPFRQVRAMLGERSEVSEHKELILLPPIARFFGPKAMGVVQILERIPFLRGHWMARFDKELS